ncbi:MAG TPA: STT3 domain-containing protein [Pyrinomonadaceae bacterium]|nr:STT3 domain-containing protein [Pyrinomonadaceae bacterium]
MRPKLLRWLFIAGALHVALTTIIFLIGHFQLLPGVFDQNGIGLTFAIDGATYRRLASEMATHWQTYGMSPWLDIKSPLHARLYSIPFLVLGRFVGHNILAAEPLNLFYYLGILAVVYLLGRELFNERAGLLASMMVGLWPTFLFHSTQLIRDPLAISCLLSLVLVLMLLLNRKLSLPKTVVPGVSGAALVTVFWLARGNMWNAVVVAVAITLVLLSFRMIRERKFMTGNAMVLTTIVVAMLFVPSRLESTTLGGYRAPATPLAIPSASQPAPREGVWSTAINQIRDRRGGFRFYTAQESNIGGEIQFTSLSDIVRFVPRAAVIGFFAPFPTMWFETGSYGAAGRLISGAETLAMYFLYAAVLVCLWRERRRLAMWLVFLTATVGLIGLGLVVVNAGALYRLRYVFWIMLIVIAAQGIYLTTRRTSPTKS